MLRQNAKDFSIYHHVLNNMPDLSFLQGGYTVTQPVMDPAGENLLIARRFEFWHQRDLCHCCIALSKIGGIQN